VGMLMNTVHRGNFADACADRATAASSFAVVRRSLRARGDRSSNGRPIEHVPDAYRSGRINRVRRSDRMSPHRSPITGTQQIGRREACAIVEFADRMPSVCVRAPSPMDRSPPIVTVWKCPNWIAPMSFDLVPGLRCRRLFRRSSGRGSHAR